MAVKTFWEKRSPAVMERIDRYVVVEGERLRGWHPHRRFGNRYDLDVIGPKKFIAKFGREAYRKIPKEVFFRDGHRKAIPYEWVLQWHS
jgi:hypothetical protein